MDGAPQAALCGLILGISILSASHSNSYYAFEKPIHTSIITLLLSALAIYALSKVSPRLFNASAKDQQYTALPLEDLQPHPLRAASPDPDTNTKPYNVRTLRFLFIAAILAVCIRLELLRRILKNWQCSKPGFEVLIPFLLGLYDLFLKFRTRPSPPEEADDDFGLSGYDVLLQSFSRNRSRYLIPTLFISWGALLNARIQAGPRSTYICPLAQRNIFTVPSLQFISVLSDCFILIVINEIVNSKRRESNGKGNKGPLVVAWICLASATIWLLIGAILFAFKPEYRSWIGSLPKASIGTILWQNILIAFSVISGLQALPQLGLLGFSLIVTFTSASVSGITLAWVNHHPFPPVSASTVLLSTFLLFVGIFLYLRTESLSRSSSHIPTWIYVLFICFFLVRLSLEFWRSTEVTFHPIDMLIYEAKSEHDAWFKQASKSMGLGQAMGEYRKRYNRAPPPNFDEWYKYATTRGSLIIDDFDSINDDLLPFWSLSPKEIRLRTWEMISNPWNEISGISIRNGEVQLSPNVLPTHRWMLDGVASMIRNFAQFLPDMDLAFNLNDESRVAVPYEEMEKMRKAGRIAALTAATTTSNWSESRAEGWKPIPSSSLTTTRFVDSSFHNTFDTYGSIGCPPNSAARTARSWNTRDVCISCLYPHTLGQFVQNWTLASSPCHQPDLARLHGFYLSPAAFKTTHDLMPVFSQSRPHPYADILYPSAWNYIDKVIYDPTELHPDPPFPEKGPDLFWRGATSEGVSPGTGTWKGMTRQRLAHLSSNLTDAQSVLLPTSSTNQGHPSQYRYVSLSPSDLASILPPLNASIVSSIARCGGPDCSAQKAEFPFAQPIDFQAHWRHKYLFDVDGAGFSGRFLPFLQSRSLPFKSALFREWYHHRLAAWMHFVPVDLRLGGVWSLLAYFEGVDGAAAAGAGKRIGKDISRVKWAGHEKEAMRIAEAGRYWSQKVVRKEDMEVYFFRLLLEWGRLTDDQREGLAFGA